MIVATPSPRITVVTTFLNAEPFIAETIASVLSQTYSDFEYVLVDDGSTDQSTAIARRFAAEHPGVVTYLEHDGHRNLGMSASRNAGIAAARGEFIALVDADDVWTPNKLVEQLAIMDRYPEVGIVAGAARYWGSWEGGHDKQVPAGPVLDRAMPPGTPIPLIYPLGETHAPCPSVLLVRRTVIDAVGGFEQSFTGRLQMYEDQAFLLKAYLVTSTYFSSTCWLHYRQHADSCVADNIRAGHYHAIRQHFIKWFSDYLNKSDVTNPAILAATRRALFRYEHPRIIYVTNWLRNRLPKWARRRAGRFRRRHLWS